MLALLATGLVVRSLAGSGGLGTAVAVEDQRSGVGGLAIPGGESGGAVGADGPDGGGESTASGSGGLGPDDAADPGGAPDLGGALDPGGALEPGGTPAGGDPSGPRPAPLVVHVAGQVHDPGVVELAPGARVHEALAAAGGARPEADLAAVNLARVVVDGEQVYVPAPGEVVPAVGTAPGQAGGGQSGSGQIGGLVDLNRATVAELDALPGIGPVLAQRIVDWRGRNGRFTVVEELGEVSGIGPAILGRLRDLVTV